MTEPNFEFPAYREAKGKLDAARQRQAALFAEAGPDLDFSKIKSISGDTAAKVKAIQDAESEMADLKKNVESLKAVAIAAANAKGYQREGGEDRGSEKKERSAAQQFDALIPNLKSKHFNRPATIEVKTTFSRSAGWDPFDMRDSRVELTPLRPAVHVVNFIPSGTISQSDYKYMEETTHTATNTAEIDEAGTYGEAAFALTERSKPVQKVGAWVPVTDEQLEDEAAAGPYLRNRLTQQVQRHLDKQVLIR